MSTELDRYGGADAYGAYDARRSEERERELRCGTCGGCPARIHVPGGRLRLPGRPARPVRGGPARDGREMGCEEWEAA